ncbi:MAG: hypothetical protein OEX22_10230 [Cyclobacteriaceae bacterium]|nr:hypothetical protein [Cyclobacteriaceae bacterium]
MKNFNFLLTTAIIGVVLTACQEQEVITSTEQANDADIQYIYLLDNEVASSNVFDLSDEGLNILVSSEKNQEKTNIVIRAFTDEKDYIKFGEQHDIKLKEQLMFEKHMRSYAVTSGAIAEYEKTGIVPESYSLYEKDYYNKSFGQSNARTESVNTALYKNFPGGGGSSIIMFGTMPAMGLGWNNVVSSFEGLGVYGFTTMYDRSFYRNKLFTYWHWGFVKIPLSGPLAGANDKMSSGVSN